MMVRPLRVIVSAFVVTFLTSSATAVCDADTDTQVAEWTVMVYLDGDNDLEKVGVNDFLDMSSVGSSEDVNIVVQFDRIGEESGEPRFDSPSPGYDHRYEDWTGTMRFFVEPGMTPSPENAVMDLGELNMGDPDTLADFISWGVVNYPAEQYVLIIWDHGGGWGDIGMAVCLDYTSIDGLSMADVETALMEGTSSSGERIDVLGYDACLMAMAEVMYETIEHVDYVVASEDLVPAGGWPYDVFLADLVAVPEMSPADLSEIIVDRFMQYYGSGQQICLSAVDMTAAQEMYVAIDHFAQELIEALPEDSEMIADCRSNTTTIDWGTSHVDLHHFASNVRDKCTTPGLKIAADNLMTTIEAAAAEEHSRKYWDLGGVSMYFPESRLGYNADYELILDFTADTSWDEFLIAYLDVGGNMLPIAQMTWWPEQPEPGQEVFFSAEGSWDPDGWIIDYIWNFGDNLQGYGLYVDHVYEAAGDYLVTLRVFDDEYEFGFVSAVISVG